MAVISRSRIMGSDRQLGLREDKGLAAVSRNCLRRRSGNLVRLCAACVALMLVTFLLYGCRRSDSSSSSNTGPAQSKAAPAPRTDFEQKLDYVRNGQFNHIYVFSRKDGGAFDREDVEYLTANSPVGEKTNMRVKTEDGRRVVIGTNFEYEPAQFTALSKRFNIEDYTSR
jgi:hypothetical protein